MPTAPTSPDEGGARQASAKPTGPAPAPAPEPTPPAGATAAAADGPPPLIELERAWKDTILAELPNKARVRFAGGRFVASVAGSARFGLPNAVHAKRCEEVRAEVEAALTAHFGRPVALTIVVDDDPTPPAGSAPVRPSGPPEDGDDGQSTIDPGELVDAHDVTTSSLGRIAEVFPGVEVVEEP